MYKYINVDINGLKKHLTPWAVYVWIPAQILRLPACKPKNAYIVDCFFASLIDNPYASIILMRKLPNPEKIKILDRPCIKVKEVYSECREVSKDFSDVIEDIVTNNYQLLQRLIDEIYEYRDVEFTIRYFIRSKRYVIRGERIKEIDKKIAISATENLMHSLCIYDKKSRKKLSTPINVEKYYVLMYVDPIKLTSGIAIERKLVEVKTYLNLIKKLNLEDLFAVRLR